MRENRAWLCLPPALFCAADHMVTLWGQPPSYWGGAFRSARELAPHGRWLLQQHPLIFALFGLLWLCVYGSAILVLPRRMARALALAVVIGHCWGIGTWLPVLFDDPYGYALCLLLALGAGVIVVLAWEKADGYAGLGAGSSPFEPKPTAAAGRFERLSR